MGERDFYENGNGGNGQAKPPMRFMEGEEDKRIPNTHGKEWDEVDETGRTRKVHRRPHWQLPAPMSQDKSPTMEDNGRAVEERQKRGSSTGPTPEDIAQKKIADKQEAIKQEIRIRQFTDWAPNVVNNDWMGGIGATLAVPFLASGSGRVMKLGTAFALGAAGTQVVQTVLNDWGDRATAKNDHGFEWKWLSDGVLWPSTLWTSAAMSDAVGKTLALNPQYSKYAKIGSLLARVVPIGVGLGASTMAHSIDKATHNDQRNPTYSTWCQQAWWDSALTTFVGAGAYFKGGLKTAIPATLATWAACRVFNAANPYPTPANEFDKSLVALDKFQKERSPAAMEEAIGHLGEFGNFGRTGLTRMPWDLKNVGEVPGYIHDFFVDTVKHRVNGNSTAPELYKFATIFKDSEHNKGGYAGTIAHAIVNFEAGQRALKWGSIGIEKPLGDSVGQDTNVDLGGEALRKFITARREIDECITYAQSHDGQVPEGDSGGKPINAEAEVKMLTDLRNRVDQAIQEITGPHVKLGKVIDDVKNRLWYGHHDAVNELQADIKERAKHPKLQDPILTPMLQAKLCRDAAMIDLAKAEIKLEGKIGHNNGAASESSKQMAFFTSPMPELQVTFGESLAMLSWARTKMKEEALARTQMIETNPGNTTAQKAEIELQQAELKRIQESLTDLQYIADRAYALYDKVKKAGLPDMQVMSEYLEDFRAGKLKMVVMDYSSDAANRAAIRNGRNSIKDELDGYANPPQVTPADRQREQAAEEERTQQEQAQNQEATQLQNQNETMQQAEIDLANRREAFARAHFQEGVEKFRLDHNGQVPNEAEMDGILDDLMKLFDYLHRTGQLKEAAPPADASSQAPQAQPQQTSGAAPQQQQAPQQAWAQPQQQQAPQQAWTQPQQQQAPYQAGTQPQAQQMPSQFQGSQPAYVDPNMAMRAKVQQFRAENKRRPKTSDLARMARELGITDFRMLQPRPDNSATTYQPWAPQEPVQVIHESAPDQ